MKETMIMCSTIRQLFKRSRKSIEELTKELNDDSRNVRISEEKFEKKCKNLINAEIKKIHSLTEDEKKQKLGEVSRGFQYWNSVNMEILSLAPLIKRKHEIVKKHLKDYENALRKSTDHSK